MKSLTYDHGVILLATVIANRKLISPARTQGQNDQKSSIQLYGL